VLNAFGARGDPKPLAGGEGTSWRAGDLVFKPLQDSASVEEIEFHAELFDSIDVDGFRVPRSRRTGDGSLIVDGWTAAEYLEGRHEDGRWADVIGVGERLHAAIAHVRRPAFIARRIDRWAVGDRVAWGELPIEDFFRVKHVPRLASALRPLDAPSQLVHGDLTGNVLFHDTLPPAVIDFAPYWRPRPFFAAVVVGDALLWEGADETLLAAVAHIREFPQYLLRALIYRAVVDRLFRPHLTRPDDEDFFLAPVELALRLAAKAK
jgi:uncharacterized protein (TIGR02569 family)